MLLTPCDEMYKIYKEYFINIYYNSAEARCTIRALLEHDSASIDGRPASGYNSVSRSERGKSSRKRKNLVVAFASIELFLHDRSNSPGSKLKLFSEQQLQVPLSITAGANI